MKKMSNSANVLLLSSLPFLFSCNNKPAEKAGQEADTTKTAFRGFGSQQKMGEHLVLIGGCHDCHTPKKMTPKGPDLDLTLALSGHPSQLPAPDVNRKDMEAKGYAVTQTLTSWVGPWGVSYAANLTPDATGLGDWEESNFFTALRKGKHKGVETERGILPPMPWQMYQNMTDEEIKAVFAYLKSIKPIKNIVPQALPPVTAQR